MGIFYLYVKSYIQTIINPFEKLFLKYVQF